MLDLPAKHRILPNIKVGKNNLIVFGRFLESILDITSKDRYSLYINQHSYTIKFKENGDRKVSVFDIRPNLDERLCIRLPIYIPVTGETMDYSIGVRERELTIWPIK